MNSTEFEDELERQSLIGGSGKDQKLRLKDVVAGKQTLAFQLKPQVSDALFFKKIYGIILLNSFYGLI